ncbi:MAG: hypothetical protein ACMVO3_00335 [Thalassobaculum sp.]
MSASPRAGSPSPAVSVGLDPVAVAADLIRCPSVTPEEGGALDLLQSLLEPMGFTCHRLRFEAPGTPTIDNLYARRGNGSPHLLFRRAYRRGAGRRRGRMDPGIRSTARSPTTGSRAAGPPT